MRLNCRYTCYTVHPPQIGHSTDVAKIGRFARYLREVFRADADAATLRCGCPSGAVRLHQKRVADERR